MNRIIKILCLLVTTAASAHAPVEHVRDGQQVELSEVRTLIMTFRRSGNDEYLETAWRLMQPELNSNASAETLLTYAFLSQSRHQFDTARTYLHRSIVAKPRNNEAYLLLASINLVTGDAQAARDACGQLQNAPPLVSISCYSRVALINNESRVAYPKLAKLLKIPNILEAEPVTIAWAESIAGDLAFQAGKPVYAIAHYQRSLAIEDIVQVRAALADVLLFVEQPQRVIELIDQHDTALPLLVRRLVALKALNKYQPDTHMTNVLNEAFTQWIADQDWLHAREMSRFYLDVLERPKLARMLAAKNIEIQKEPEDWRLLHRSSQSDSSETTSPEINSPKHPESALSQALCTHPLEFIDPETSKLSYEM